MTEQQSYSIESYALFKNVDETILKLNPIIKKKGYEFVSFNLSELEKNFSGLYSLPEKYDTSWFVVFDKGVTISNEFYQAYQNSSIGNTTSTNPKAFFLKRIKKFDRLTVNNTIELGKSMKVIEEMQKFRDALIRKLKLFENGNIMSPILFQVRSDSRKIEYQLMGRIMKPITHKLYSIKDKDIIKLEKHLNQDLESTKLTELAEMYFESSYELYDAKIRFTNLIIALESLFNCNKDKISHTIAKHLSIIISINKEEFERNYKRIKKLYRIRGQIVHGQTDRFKENIDNLTDEVQNLARTAILYCIRTKMNKQELFLFLNSAGF